MCYVSIHILTNEKFIYKKLQIPYLWQIRINLQSLIKDGVFRFRYC